MHSNVLLRLLGVGALLSACAPIVTHGPNIERGLQGYAGLAGRTRTCDTSCGASEAAMPTAVFGLRYGWVPTDPAKPAAQFSAGLNFFVPELDLYVQGPRRATAPDFGAGVQVSVPYLMPYLQLGTSRDDGSALYTTQAVVLGNAEFDLDPELGQSSLVAPRYWAPTVAYRFPTAPVRVNAFVSGGLGSYRREIPGQDAERRPLRFLMLGLGAETGSLGSIFNRERNHPRQPTRCRLFEFCPPPGGR